MKQTVVISAYNIRRLDFRYGQELQSHLGRAKRTSCNKIILNLAGVRQIEKTITDMLLPDQSPALQNLPQLCLVNLDQEVEEQLRKISPALYSCICVPSMLEEFRLAMC